MPTLTIRNVDPETHQALREQAAANGRSMEAEVRAMLQERVKRPPLTGAELVRRIRARVAAAGGEHVGIDLELPPREPMGEPRVDFSGPEFGVYDDEESDDAA